MKLRKLLLFGIFITVICAISAVVGFVWGTYIQYGRIVSAHGTEVANDLLTEQICAKQGCDALRPLAAADLPLVMDNYSSEYALYQEPFPRNVLYIAGIAWRLRHVANYAALTPPRRFHRAIRKLRAQKPREPNNAK